MAFKPKAEIMFEAKTKLAVERRDWNEVAHLFHLYGCYLELVSPIPDPDPAPIPEPTGKELVHLPYYGQEPQAEEEIIHVLSGEHARWCVETLHVDPVTLVKIDPERFPTYEAFLEKYVRA